MAVCTKWILAAVLLAGAGMVHVSKACTSVIVSGKITEDGRPIMWKNRDANGSNRLKYFGRNDVEGGKYALIGIVNSGVATPRNVWGGTNEAGLCVMNTLSFNADTTAVKGKTSSGNGIVQLMTLSLCATVDEVETYLESLPKPTGLDTNLGVIDAKGNCAYFECHSYGFKKFDVNDPTVAPEGFIARSNFSIATRPTNEGRGQIRYNEAVRQMRHAIADGMVNVDFLLNNVARSFCNPMLGIDLKSGNFNKPRTTGWYADEDFITRFTSQSGMIFQGVKDGESPELTTMWTIVGYPAATVCIPAWVKGGEKGQSMMLSADTTYHSPMQRYANTLRKSVYTYKLDNTDINTKKYFEWEKLFNLQNTGIMQKVLQKEFEILPTYKAALESWRKKNKVNVKELMEINKTIDEDLDNFYKQEFNL